MINQEPQGFKTKLREFTKKYFLYRQDDENLTAEVKKELARLGGELPSYYDNDQERTVLLTNLRFTDNPAVLKIYFQQIQAYFSVTSPEATIELAQQIREYKRSMYKKMGKIKAAKERKRQERYGN